MSVGNLLATLIIAVVLLGALYLDFLISVLISALPSPWGFISNSIVAVLGLTAIVYVWLGKLEKKKKVGTEHGKD